MMKLFIISLAIYAAKPNELNKEQKFKLNNILPQAVESLKQANGAPSTKKSFLSKDKEKNAKQSAISKKQQDDD